MQIATVTYLVREYDEAIHWFTTCLGFTVLQDEDLGAGKRWVRVAAAEGGPALLLAKAVGADQVAAVGKAAGGRVAYFLHCKDFSRTHTHMQKCGVHFRETPRVETYGTVAVFEDLYGNGWDLIAPT